MRKKLIIILVGLVVLPLNSFSPKEQSDKAFISIMLSILNESGHESSPEEILIDFEENRYKDLMPDDNNPNESRLKINRFVKKMYGKMVIFPHGFYMYDIESVDKNKLELVETIFSQLKGLDIEYSNLKWINEFRFREEVFTNSFKAALYTHYNIEEDAELDSEK